MDALTLALFRCLQSGPFDESGLTRIRGLLRTQRRVLRARQDQTALREMIQLLEQWAHTTTDARLAANALAEAAEIAERDLQEPQLAAELRGEAGAQRSQQARPPIGATDHADLAEQRVQEGDLDGAIEALENALNVDARRELVQRLAELFVKRGKTGDAQQAADLYCTLGDVLGNPAGIVMLERALAQVPTHAEAKRLLYEYTRARVPAPAAAARHSAPTPARRVRKLPAPPAAGARALPQAAGHAPPTAHAPAPPQAAARAQLTAAAGPTPLRGPALSVSAPTGTTAEVGTTAGYEPADDTRGSTPDAPASFGPVVIDDALAAASASHGGSARRHWRAASAAIVLGSAAAIGLLMFEQARVAPEAGSAEQHANATSGATAPAATTQPSAASAVVELARPSGDAPAGAAPNAAEAAADTRLEGAATKAAEAAGSATTSADAGPNAIAASADPTPAPAERTASVTPLLDKLEQRGGKLSSSQLSSALAKLTPKLEQCYGEALERRPRTRGRLVVSFAVRPNGRVSNAKKASGTIKDAELTRCSLQAVAGTRFAKPRKQAAKLKLPLEYRRS